VVSLCVTGEEAERQLGNWSRPKMYLRKTTRHEYDSVSIMLPTKQISKS